jgi:hypothetical protein
MKVCVISITRTIKTTYSRWAGGSVFKGTSHPARVAGRVLGSIPKREEPGKTGAPCVKVQGSSTGPRVQRDGQTSPRRPRLVVSRSTCPPLSPSPHGKSFVIGTAVINTHTPRCCSNNQIKRHLHLHTHTFWVRDPLFCPRPRYIIVATGTHLVPADTRLEKNRVPEGIEGNHIPFYTHSSSESSLFSLSAATSSSTSRTSASL